LLRRIRGGMWGVAEWNLRTKYVRLTFIPHAGPVLVHHVDSTAKLGRNRCEWDANFSFTPKN
jgi:hypothetical protein